MKVLVVNCGGATLKYRLYAMPEEAVLAEGGIDRLGSGAAVVRWKVGAGARQEVVRPVEDHLAGLRLALEQIAEVTGDGANLDGVAFKMAHCGAEVPGAGFVDGRVVAALERYAAVVPVHNRPLLAAIAAMREALPGLPLTYTVETHFHTTLEPAAWHYALPAAWHREHGVRRYGFHSCSHRFVAGRVAELLGRPVEGLRTVICHLGSGTSVCGVRGGQSVEISSGFTPQSGTPMSTRPGDFDPFVVTYLAAAEGLGHDELNRVLTAESGLAGLSGVGGDLRDIRAAAAAGSADAQLAIDVFVWNIRRWIGSCLMATGGADALAFTGGIGENDARLRADVCADLGWLGLRLDPAANDAGDEGLVSAAESAVAVLTVRTDEEIVVARDAYRLLAGAREAER